MGIFEGQLRVDKGDRFALVASRFNEFIVDRLVGAPPIASSAMAAARPRST